MRKEMQFEPYHLWAACAAGLGWCLYRIIYNLFLHSCGHPWTKIGSLFAAVVFEARAEWTSP